MNKTRAIAVSLIGLVGALAGVGLLPQQTAHTQQPQQPQQTTHAQQKLPSATPLAAVAGPLPPVPTPPNITTLEPVEQLGKDLLYDNTMSNPTGYACAQCHAPTTGFTTGLSSVVNLAAGVPPGVIPGRWDNRRAYTYGYAAFSPEGVYYDATLGVYVGGNFWDGRAYDTAVQAQGPPINPNEMNNTPAGTAPNQYSPLLVQKVQHRPYTPLFYQIYGPDVFTKYTQRQIYEIWGEAISAFEASGEVCQFSSKYDASQYGVPAQNIYTLSASEERGRVLYFGSAQCFQCHSSAGFPGVQLATEGKNTLTMYCFANIGVPKNPNNPYYQMTDPVSNPTGYNPLGTNYIDYGLGDNAVGGLDGTKFFNKTPGDKPQFRGLFLTPTTRNVDLRPSPTFVKAYFHNGWAKSLQQAVHFYNTRNIAVNANGQQVAFDLRKGPPSGYTAIWPPPEVLDNVQNVIGYTPAQAAAKGTTGVTAENGQVGNLQLTASQEGDLVNFLKILSDGYTKPNPPASGD
jgi:cytochrome c peroxidase